MFLPFAILAVVSLVCAVVGFVLVLTRWGQAKRLKSKRRLVRSSGFSVEGELTFADMKAALAAGRIGDAIGGVLAVAGMLGLMLFGSLALFFSLHNKVVGAVIVAICAFGVVRMAYRVIKA